LNAHTRRKNTRPRGKGKGVHENAKSRKRRRIRGGEITSRGITALNERTKKPGPRQRE